MAETGLPARRSAAFLLDRVIGDQKLLSELLGAGVLDRLSPQDRARAQRLATETLRALPRADLLIKRHVQKLPPLPILNLLRLGTLELSQGAAAHGVVNDLVTLAARNKRHGRLKGLVNAVLRKLAKDVKDWDSLPLPRMPRWLREPLSQAWGRKAMAKIEAAHFAGAPLDLTLQRDVPELEGEKLPTGSLRLKGKPQVTTLPGYETGDFWVQDAAAALPAKLIRGHRVLDLCAAPGGKTLQLAAAGHAVTAVDISENRLGRVKENLARARLSAKIIASDAFDITGQWDAVLLDAPCSATGTIRRHPDLPYAKDGSEFGELIALQSRLIDHALTLLAPGGQLVFCTCSLLPDEGEVQIQEALTRHTELRLDIDAMQAPWINDAWRSSEGGLRVRPDFWAEQGGMDGFYICALRKLA
jgi:16S rRNA (cytosine967-C5)-methyltransferase